MSNPRIYWNLHRKCWSVKTDGKPVEHADTLVLTSVRFKVWEGGRQRVLAEQRKRVHAFACGFVAGTIENCSTVTPNLTQVSYNPYKAGHFYRTNTGERVDEARLAILTSDGKVFCLLNEGSDTGKRAKTPGETPSTPS